MKKFFAVLMLAAALILPGLAQAKDAQTSMIDDVVKRGVLRVGFSSFVPWAMQDKNGEFVGFEIDVAKRLAKDLGVELQLVPTKWAGIMYSGSRLARWSRRAAAGTSEPVWKATSVRLPAVSLRGTTTASVTDSCSRSALSISPASMR